MSLTVGLATGLWMFSLKTLQAWKAFFCCKSCQAPSMQKTYPGSTYEGSQQQFILTRPLITSASNSLPPSQQPIPTAITLEHTSRPFFNGSSSNGGHYMTTSIGNNYNKVNGCLANNTASAGQHYDISWKTSKII